MAKPRKKVSKCQLHPLTPGLGEDNIFIPDEEYFHTTSSKGKHDQDLLELQEEFFMTAFEKRHVMLLLSQLKFQLKSFRTFFLEHKEFVRNLPAFKISTPVLQKEIAVIEELKRKRDNLSADYQSLMEELQDLDAKCYRFLSQIQKYDNNIVSKLYDQLPIIFKLPSDSHKEHCDPKKEPPLKQEVVELEKQYMYKIMTNQSRLGVETKLKEAQTQLCSNRRRLKVMADLDSPAFDDHWRIEFR